MLDWRVTTFLDVCETLNYTHTAKRLNITQPAVSQHISWIEQQLHTTLFIREGKRLHLTESGQLARIFLQKQTQNQTLLLKELTAVTQTGNHLSIGATLTAGEHLLAGPLALWHNAHPQVRLSVDVDDTSQLLSKLDASKIDCALVEGIFDSSRYTTRLWSHERMVCIASPHWKPNSNKSAYTFRDLLDETLILREEGSGSRAVLEASLANQNLQPESFAHIVVVKSLGMAREMAAAGAGITFAYEPAIAKERAMGLIQEIPLKDTELEHDICFVWQRDTYFDTYYERLFNELQKLSTNSTSAHRVTLPARI